MNLTIDYEHFMNFLLIFKEAKIIFIVTFFG